MLTNDEMRDIDKGLLPMRIMWIALLIACGIYIIIANVVETGTLLTEGEDPDDVLNLVGYLLYALSAIQLATAYYFRRAVTSQRSLFSRIFNSPEPHDPSTVTSPEDYTEQATGRYFIGIFLSLALTEAIAVYGLILCIMNADFFSLYLLTGIAIAAQLYFRPKKQELIGLTIQLKRGNRIQ